MNATDSLSGLMVPIHRALFCWSLPVAWSQMYAHLLDPFLDDDDNWFTQSRKTGAFPSNNCYPLLIVIQN